MAVLAQAFASSTFDSSIFDSSTFDSSTFASSTFATTRTVEGSFAGRALGATAFDDEAVRVAAVGGG